MITPALKVSHLSKRVQGLPQIIDVSFEVFPGEIYGLLGVQGAGKSMLLRILVSLAHANYGSIEVFGERLTPENPGVLSQVGCLLNPPGFYETMSIRDNLEIQVAYTGLHDPRRVGEVLKLFELEREAHIKLRNIPEPKRQLIALARAIIHRPRLLLLDEPFSHLDSMSVRKVSEILGRLALIGETAILVTGKQVNEVVQLVDRIGILHHGQLLHELPTLEISNRIKRKYRIRSDNPQVTLQALDSAGFTNIHLMEDGLIQVADNDINVHLLITTLAAQPASIRSFETKQASIEELLLNVIAQKESHV